MKRLCGLFLLFVFATTCMAQTAQTASPNRYNSFLFGVDYYPEHWPETMWEMDARRMRECGAQAVRIGEFAWALMEPKEGAFDFSLFDRTIAAGTTRRNRQCSEAEWGWASAILFLAFASRYPPILSFY